MGNYLSNLKAWFTGWKKFDQITKWSPGWEPGQLRWKVLYATDYLVTPLFFAGPVVSMSGWMNKHRDGAIWNEALDVIEKIDPGHGGKAGPPLWETTECSFKVRLAVPIIWLLLFFGVFNGILSLVVMLAITATVIRSILRK